MIIYLTFFSFRTFTLGFNFASTDITVEEETWVYPGLSFVSELGGALGLFLGLSFLSLWDILETLIKAFKNCYSKEKI